MKLKAESIFRLGVMTILAGGMLWTMINVLRADVSFQRMQGKLDVIRQLREIKLKQDFLKASFDTLAAVSNAAPPLAVLAAAVTSSVAEVRELDSQTLERGWNVKRTEIRFNEVNLNAVVDFLRVAETRRPPWRLADCVIIGSKKADSYATVTLTMETVSKTGNGPPTGK